MAAARRRKFWGWGYEDERVPQEEAERVLSATARSLGPLPSAPTPPRVEDLDLLKPRIAAPGGALGGLVTADPAERVAHSYGGSFADIARAFLRRVPSPPDLVAFPESAQEVEALLDWASGANVAVIPYGGGTSVCGGVEADVGESYAGALSLDLTRMDRVVEVDRASRAALIEGGARCPGFEAQLKPHGLTLRHFPQSFLMATLGGMIVTRSGGHFATLYTHIDEFVEAVEMVTPRGIMETRRLPGSGAGPQPERLVCGSEGTLGIVTRAWMRLQDVPRFRASATARFEGLAKAAEAVRAIAQSGLNPANCRLIDAQEAALNGSGDGRHDLLVLGFESADHPQDARLARAAELVRDHGGIIDPAGEGARPEAAEAWRNAFIRAPYYRELRIPHGIIADTFETACLWSDFEAFHAGITSDVRRILKQATGREGSVTCRFTHVYPDGPAPYFTFHAMSDPARMLDAWKDIKLAINEVVVGRGGTVTHHHAVGRDHRHGGYDRERPALFADALMAAKQRLDPAGILNPGVLIDAPGKTNGGRGVLAS